MVAETFALRPMTLADIAAVMSIEQAVKSSPWTAASYRAEVENETSFPTILTDERSEIIGYIVYWLIADEVQVQTLVVAPAWRGCGLGAWLLLHGLCHGVRQGATRAILEVRQSNQTAQALYCRYRFVVVGHRPDYYRDNGETALLMTAEPLDDVWLGQQRALLQVRLSET